MSNNRIINYLLVGIGSFIAGFLYYTQKNKTRIVDENLNKTLAIQKGDKYYLIFNSVVALTREITKQQYDNFLQQYPSAKAPNNVLNLFSTPPPKYTKENGRYYEYKWNGSDYDRAIEITKDEFDFLTKKNTIAEINI